MTKLKYVDCPGGCGQRIMEGTEHIPCPGAPQPPIKKKNTSLIPFFILALVILLALLLVGVVHLPTI